MYLESNRGTVCKPLKQLKKDTTSNTGITKKLTEVTLLVGYFQQTPPYQM